MSGLAALKPDRGRPWYSPTIMTRTLDHENLGELRFEQDSYWTCRLRLPPHRKATKVLLPGSLSGPFEFAADWAEGLVDRYAKIRNDIYRDLLKITASYPEALPNLPRKGGILAFEDPGELWDHIELRVVELIDHWEFELVYSFLWELEDFHVLHFEYGALSSVEKEDRRFLLELANP